MTDTTATQTPVLTATTSPSVAPEAPALSPAAAASILKLKFHKTGFGGANGIFATLLLAFAKTFRINFTAQSDLPCALSLAPFETLPSHLPLKAIEAVGPAIQTLERLGFTQPLWHHLDHAAGSADTVLVHMLHPSGQYVARIVCHLLRIRKQPVTFVQFFSEVSGGQMLLTWPRGFELATPPDWVVHKFTKGSITELFAAHRKKLIEIAGPKPVVTHNTPDALREFMERRQNQLMQLQVQRGICVPLSPDEQQRLVKRAQYGKVAREISGEHADVLSEIARLQENSTNWGSTIFILVVSLFAFIAAGLTRDKWDYKFLLILIGVLFVHELGHYFAMKLSGYRNLRMFFIPFLGAAVSGQSYNVPGWKKTIVSLMGPVPGILLAIPLGIAGLATGNDTLTLIAMMSLILNALNLVPVLPLDGGWVLHHILFSRNVHLELVFRILAIGALFLASIGLSDKLLMYVGIATAVQIPFAYKLAQIVAELRRANFQPVSHDDHSIPPEAAIPIIERVKAAFPRNLTTRAAATHTIAVFDRLNSRPPGWVASILFLFAHGACLLVAIICALVFMVGMHGGFNRFSLRAPNDSALEHLAENTQLKLRAHVDTTLTLSPPPARNVPPVALSADYADHAAALDAARRIKPAAPSDAGLLVLGQTLLISLNADDDTIRERIAAALSEGGTKASVRRPDQPCSLMLQFDLPDDSQPACIAELSAFLSAPHRNRDYAPWDASDPRTPDAKARAAAIAKVRTQILNLPDDDATRKASDEFSRKYFAALKQRDTALQKQLLADHEAARKALRLQWLAQLAKDDPAHATLINAARDAVNRSGESALFTELNKLIEPYLELMPEGSPNLMGVSYGNAYSFEKTAAIELMLISPAHSAPEVIKWLHQRGMQNPRYRLSVYPPRDPAAEEGDD